jgi:hypothetical protein
LVYCPGLDILFSRLAEIKTLETQFTVGFLQVKYFLKFISFAHYCSCTLYILLQSTFIDD